MTAGIATAAIAAVTAAADAAAQSPRQMRMWSHQRASHFEWQHQRATSHIISRPTTFAIHSNVLNTCIFGSPPYSLLYMAVQCIISPFHFQSVPFIHTMGVRLYFLGARDTSEAAVTEHGTRSIVKCSFLLAHFCQFLATAAALRRVMCVVLWTRRVYVSSINVYEYYPSIYLFMNTMK